MIASPALSAQSVDEQAARNALITGSPPRIAPLAEDQFTDEQRRISDEAQGIAPTANSARGNQALVNEMVGVLVRNPAVYDPHMALARAFFFRGSLSPRDRELAILRTAWLSQSPFEWGEHVGIAKDCNITPEEIERVIEGSAAEGWSDYDRALIGAAEELHHDSMISDQTWAVLARTLNEAQLIELVMLVGQYKTVAYYLNSLRLRLRENNPGLSAR
jgi:alkylhydroperoxidase family enzyme